MKESLEQKMNKAAEELRWRNGYTRTVVIGGGAQNGRLYVDLGVSGRGRAGSDENYDLLTMVARALGVIGGLTIKQGDPAMREAMRRGFQNAMASEIEAAVLQVLAETQH